MFDVFTLEIEVLIKDGIANLYWYKSDLHKAWLRSGVTQEIKEQISGLKSDDGHPLSKRRQMDALYECLRQGEYDRRLEVSRNLVRILVTQKSFAPQNEKHRVDVSERCALKLREIIVQQEKELSHKNSIHFCKENIQTETYQSRLGKLQSKFREAITLSPQKRGYALEKIFVDLMRISGLPVEESFKIEGEQIDGAIKYDGHYYLIELKWTNNKTDPKEIGHFCYKVDGKLQARGIFLAMNGYSNGVIETLPKGKELKILLLDGVHLANVIAGNYKFQDLLEHSICQASLRGKIYCSHDLNG